MKLKTLKQADIKGKKVIYRAPYDIGTYVDSKGEYQIKDNLRIRATITTLEYLLKNECKIIILTYVGRPKGEIDESLRTTPHAKVLSNLLKMPVLKLDDCVGDKVQNTISKLKQGEIVMLENTRFHQEESADDDNFAKKLARHGELIVFDGFPQSHRKHSSTTGILRHLDAYAGFYFEKEVEMLSKLMLKIERPFVTIIGGIKISDKIDAIKSLSNKSDIVLSGGGFANILLKASGKQIGDSTIEEGTITNNLSGTNPLEIAKDLLNSPNTDAVQSNKILLPVDLVISDGTKTNTINFSSTDAVIPKGWKAFDIGPKTREIYSKKIRGAKTVFWNGPLGKFELEEFAHGSKEIADSIINTKLTSIVAGGDTIAFVNKYYNLNRFTHVSLAGGATLDFLAGKKLPVLDYLTYRD